MPNVRVETVFLFARSTNFAVDDLSRDNAVNIYRRQCSQSQLTDRRSGFAQGLGCFQTGLFLKVTVVSVCLSIRGYVESCQCCTFLLEWPTRVVRRHLEFVYTAVTLGCGLTTRTLSALSIAVWCKTELLQRPVWRRFVSEALNNSATTNKTRFTL